MPNEFVARNGVIALNTSQITGSLLVTGGNVGIGTASASQKLHIYGVGDQALFVENTGTYHIYAGLSSNVGYIGSNNATPLSLRTNGSSRVYINTGGSVGIGTTSPSNLLDVTTNLDAAQRVAIFRNLFATGYTSIAIDRPNTARYSFLEHTTAGTTDWYVGTGYNGLTISGIYGIGFDGLWFDMSLFPAAHYEPPSIKWSIHHYTPLYSTLTLSKNTISKTLLWCIMNI